MYIKKIVSRKLNIIMLPLLLWSIAHPMQAVAQATGLTPDQVAQIETVTGSFISADGKHVAYTLAQAADPAKENKPSTNQLHVYRTDAKTAVPYFTSSSVRSVAFRPGKQSITFIGNSEEDKKAVLYELPLGGGAASILYRFERSISSYAWHPDGKTIAFTSSDAPEAAKNKAPYRAKVYEENRPNRKAFTLNIETGNTKPVQVQAEGSVYLVQWSPDGSKLAIAVAPTPEVDDYYMAQKVKVVNPANGNVTAEFENEGKLGQIEWSPSGDRLALRAGADINDPIDGRILIVSAQGGKPQIIDRDFKGKYEEIKWTYDNVIQFLASEGTASVIGTIQPDGTKKTTLFRSGNHAINSFSHSKNSISFVASTPTHPSEVFLLANKNKAQPERITRHNQWLNDVKLGKQEVVTYKARDSKYDIEGILIYPTDYKEGTALPTIVVVHGGPEAHYSNGWLTAYSMPGQMAAAKGYAVFYPNYRGSTGRGIEFAYSSQSDLSGKEFDDVVDGVDYLIERGITDKNRVGVTGGSYGGYASAWMSTYYSERFAAAVMFVGISNNLSKWGTSDIPNELYYVHSRQRMWESDEKWMDYLKRSPVYHVDKAQTPILIMHGEDDTRVHPAQSLELYRHIKVRKPEVPVRLVLYPGEGHGNVHSTARYEYSLRMMRWFDTYLKTGNRKAEMPHWEAPGKASE